MARNLFRSNWAGVLALVATAYLANLFLGGGNDGLVYAGLFSFVGKAAKSILPTALSFIPGLGPVAGGIASKLFGGADGGSSQAPQGGGGVFGSGISLEQLLGVGGGILGGISAGKNRGQSNQILMNLLAQQNQQTQARRPFQDLLTQNLTQGGGLQQQNPDLSSVFADSNNPFAVGPAPQQQQPQPGVTPSIPGPPDKVGIGRLRDARAQLGRGRAKAGRERTMDVDGFLGLPPKATRPAVNATRPRRKKQGIMGLLNQAIQQQGSQ